MPLPVGPLLLAAAAAGTPTPAPTETPTPAPTPRARTLADVARERRLVRLKGLATEVPAPEAQGPLRIEDLQDNGVVADGFLSVYGKVRNAGLVPACRVRLFLRTFDEHGVLLSKGEATTDLKVVAPGEAVPFGARLKVPPGVRGSRERQPDVLAEGPARTNWQRVARVEGDVLGYSEECR
jgi:hypothetical protein